MLDVSPIAIRIAVDGGHRVVFHNPSYARLVNNTQVTGEDPGQYYSDPDEYHRVLDELTKGHQVVNRQMRLRIPGAPDVWSLASYMHTEYRGQPAILGWFYDITPVQSAISEISQREQEFHRLIDHLPYGVLIHQSGVIRFCNRSATRLLGLNNADELIGKSVLELVHPDFRPAVIARISTLTEVEEEIPLIEEKLLRHDGTVFDAEVSGIRIYHEGKPASLIVFHDITRLKDHEKELKRIAHFDPLTGLPNRALLYDRMSQACAVNSRHHTILVICYLDLDGFKQINDAHGHESGDQVLVEMARRMTSTLRDGDTVARLGGDEFVILLSGYQEPNESLVTLHRLLDQLNEPIQLSANLKVGLSASMGISLFPLDDRDPDILLRHADQAMYSAKQSGKNQVEVYDPQMDLRLRRQHELNHALLDGLKNHQFELLFQPKLELITHHLLGVEALLRWHRPNEETSTLPISFLPDIHSTQLDIKLGEWVIAQVFQRLDEWRLTSAPPLPISLNLSAHHLERGQLIEYLKMLLLQYPQVSPTWIQFEILESVALSNLTEMAQTIRDCRRMGFTFALDNFGTGYSSLANLRSLSIDEIKIDRSFIQTITQSHSNRALIESILSLGQAFHCPVVAAGIETVEQYRLLRALGCRSGQGYLFSPPLTTEQLLGWSTPLPSDFVS